MRAWSRAAIAALAGSAAVFALALSTQEERGKDLFERRCSGCHALDINKEGPRLRSVYGRKAASLPDFDYSDALKKADFRWDSAALERWLTDPDAVAPGTDMALRVTNADEREAVISYLKSLATR